MGELDNNDEDESINDSISIGEDSNSEDNDIQINSEISILNIDNNKITDDFKILEISNDVLDNIKDDSFIMKNDEKKIKNINKLKLDELKQLITDKNITLDEDINTMKKADLIKILSN